MNISNQKFSIKIILFFVFFLLLSCSSKKDFPSKIIANSPCPSDGNCELKCLKNKGLLIRNNSKNGLIFEIVDNAKTNVLVYTYNRKKDEDVQDDGYREEVIFEISTDVQNLNLENEALQTTKMIFGRFCYCKGYTGYYKVDLGTLTIKSTKNLKNFILNFTVKKVPQIINKLSFSYKI